MSRSREVPTKKSVPQSRAQLFISYSSTDVDVVRSFHKRLAAIPAYIVWRDERKIERDWSREIASALTASHAVILIWSEEAARSRWVRNEWLTARALGLPIIPAVLPGAPELPPPLQNLHGVVAKAGEVDVDALATRIEAHLAAPPAYDYTVRGSGFFVPLRPNPHFVGRSADLVTLYRLVVGDLNKLGCKKIGAFGMAGIGKTQLAIEFAWRFSFAFDGVHWINAADEADWRSTFITLARDELKLGKHATPVPIDDRAWIVALASYCAAHPQLLIVMDNVVTPDRLNDPAMLLGTAPLDLGCNLIFTTRGQFELPGVDAYALGVLDSQESFALLSSRRVPAAGDEENQANEICRMLGNLPLALTLAAAYLGEYKDVSFALYRRELAARRLDTIDIQALSPEALATRHIAAVRATLQGQWEALSSPTARQLLMLTALMREGALAPKRRLGLLAGVVQDRDTLERPLDDATKLLVKISLAEATQNEGALRLHPLVREFVLGTVSDPDTLRAEAAGRLAAAYGHLETVEKEYAERGLAAVIEDTQLGVRWGGDAGSETLEWLWRLLSAESTVLYRVSHAAQPGFFLQQIAKRAVSQSLGDLAEEARSLLRERELPHFALRWRTHSASPELERTIAEGKGRVYGVALVPDGRLVTASEEGTISLWELDTGRLIETLVVPEGAVEGIAIGGGPDSVLSRSADGTLRRWDLSQAREAASLRPHGEKVSAMDVFARGTRVVTGGSDGMVRVWDARSLEPICKWRFGEPADVLTVMPGNRQVLVAYYSSPPGAEKSYVNDCGLLELRDMVSGERLWVREIHSFAVDAVIVSSDGRRVITAGRDGFVKLWDAASWERPVTIEFKDDPSVLAWLPGQLHVAVGAGREIHVLDAATTKVVRRLRAHSGVITSIAAQGSMILSAGCDDTVRVWHVDPAQAAPPFKPTGHSASVTTALSVGKVAVTGDISGELRLWGLEDGRPRGMWKGRMGMRGHAIASRDGRFTFTSTSDLEGGSINILDPSTRVEVTACSTAGRVQYVQLHPTKPLLIVAGGGGAELDVWDLGGDRLAQFVRTLKVPDGRMNWINGAALSSDGRLLAIAASEAFGSDSTVFLLDMDSGAAVARGSVADGDVQELVVTPKAELVAYLTTGGTLYFWDPATGNKARRIATGLGGDGKVVLANDGQWLVTAADEVCVWRVTGGELLQRLAGHPGVWHLAVNGPREVLTAAKDWMVSLWNIEAGTEIASLGLDDEARELSLNRDGRTLVVGDGRGDVYAFEIVRDLRPSTADRADRIGSSQSKRRDRHDRPALDRRASRKPRLS
jgi:WD40 repeat protein